MKVFVYGTLKRDKGNNGCLNGAVFIREALVHGFKLYNCGFPVAKENPETFVKGEIWDIGNPEEATGKRILERLDALEGYREHNPGGSMYLRIKVQTTCGHNVQMYLGNKTFRVDSLDECPLKDGVYEWHDYRRVFS